MPGQNPRTNHGTASNPIMGTIQLNPPKEIIVAKVKKKEKEEARDKEEARTNPMAILKQDTNLKEVLLAKARKKAKRKTSPTVTELPHQTAYLWDNGQPHQRTKTLELLTSMTTTTGAKPSTKPGQTLLEFQSWQKCFLTKLNLHVQLTKMKFKRSALLFKSKTQRFLKISASTWQRFF